MRAYKGYEVVEVFRDEGHPGGLIDRPGMQAMLAFLKKHRRRDRMSSSLTISAALRAGWRRIFSFARAIGDAGGMLESPSIEFGEDSDSQLVENLLASVSQHQRQKNAEQTNNRMRARVMNGYWVFQAPVGYRYRACEPGTGKVLVRDEPYASIVQKRWKAMPPGRFETQAEVKRFLEQQSAFPKDCQRRDPQSARRRSS